MIFYAANSLTKVPACGISKTPKELLEGEIKVRPIKMLGLATIAAVASMGLIGAFPASANQSTGICDEHLKVGEECPASLLTTTIHGSASEPLVHTSLVDVECTSSLLKVGILSLANPGVGHVEELTWTSCKTHGGTNCTASTLLTGLLNILKLSTTDAHATSTGGTAVLLKCGESIHCIYGGEPIFLAEGSPADLKINTSVKETAQHGEKFLCPNTATWLALYTSLNNVYIRS